MTRRAGKKIKALLDGKPGAGLRIDVRGNPCSPSYVFSLVENPAEGDYRLEDEGIRIYFDPRHARSLFNIQVDHDGTAGADGFTVTRTGPCG